MRNRKVQLLLFLWTADVLKMQWGSHKKLVGIRFLFPPLDEQMSLLEKAKIWVARHDYKYFVDWTEAELEGIDPILRPLSIITRDIYKLHMNRWKIDFYT